MTTPLPRQSLHVKLVHILGSRIASGELPPDTIIDLDALVTEFEVSKTVVREAVRVLADKGLLASRQKYGTFVRPRGDWNLLDSDLLAWRSERESRRLFEDLAEIRAILEPAAAALAAARRSEADIAALKAALDDMRAGVSAADADHIADADLRLHGALYKATHNEMLNHLYTVIEPTLRARVSRVFSSDHFDDPITVHQPTIDAVIRGDADAAERAARGLLDIAEVDTASLYQEKTPSS